MIAVRIKIEIGEELNVIRIFASHVIEYVKRKTCYIINRVLSAKPSSYQPYPQVHPLVLKYASHDIPLVSLRAKIGVCGTRIRYSRQSLLSNEFLSVLHRMVKYFSFRELHRRLSAVGRRLSRQRFLLAPAAIAGFSVCKSGNLP